MSNYLTQTHLDFVIDVASNKFTNKELAGRHGISLRTVGRWKEKFKDDIADAFTTVMMMNRDAVNALSSYKPEDEDDTRDELLDAVEDFENLPPAQFDNFTFTLTRNSLTVDREDQDGDITTQHCDKKSQFYKKFIETLDQSDPDDEELQDILSELFDNLRPAEKISKITMGRINIDPNDSKITFLSNGVEYVINNSLCDKILEKCLNDSKPEALIKFLDNMMDNPSSHSVENLYDFLVHNDIEITDDGYFTAWKVVRGDYLDKHTATMDNSPGKIVSMPRNMVDDDPNVTCSSGLHACSKGYIRHFSSSNDRIVKVKINPKDVAAVPVDYNSEKLRCSEYLVLEDVTDSDIWK
jgi:hypothetical protein